MGQIQSYYRILGLEADASVDEIQEAIQNMRELDTDGNYTAILNKMEKTLLPLSSRPKNGNGHGARHHDTPAPAHNDFAPDNSWDMPDFPEMENTAAAVEEDFAPKHRGTSKFLDLGDNDSINRTSVQDHRSYITEEEIRRYNRPPSTLSKIINAKNIILLILAGAVGVAGFIFGMPLYQQYLANKQSEEALPVLTRAANEVENLIRQNSKEGKIGFFPDTLSGGYNSPLYTVSINSNNETVQLTFSQEAAEPLRGHSLLMRTDYIPNMGLQWRCDISAGFPPTHKPAQCY